MSLQPPLKICFIPFYGAPSHTIPLLDLARYLSFHGHQITILATPTNGKLIQSFLDNDSIPSDRKIALHIVPMPFKEVGLPEDFDELHQPQDLMTSFKLHRTKDLLRHTVQKFLIESNPFDCIIADSMYPWSSEVAAHFKIPSISFHPFSVFSHCIREALRSPNSPHRQIQSREESFVIPGLHVPITLTKSELPPEEYLWFQEPIRVGELKCDLILTNSFQELESDGMEYFAKVTDVRVMAIGPASEIHRKISGGVERGQKVIDDKHECLSWLESKKPNSVIYVNFGSIVKLPDDQLMEIASALELSRHNFIWVALGKDESNEVDEGKWLPLGFYEKVKDRGLVVKSWAPQLSILDHPSVGGFMTHCGWNSLLEGFAAGVPMITWPLTYEQFYNEKLVTQVVGAGVEVGAKEWAYWYDIGKKIIGREKIEAAVRKLMDGGDKTEEMRKKAQGYGKMAKSAVEQGGSTYNSMLDLIEVVKKLKDAKVDK